MDVEHYQTDASAAEVLDRVLDKGILVEAPRVTPEAGLSQISAVSRVRVLRVEAHLEHTLPRPSDARAA
jgi:hypothetical protein